MIGKKGFAVIVNWFFFTVEEKLTIAKLYGVLCKLPKKIKWKWKVWKRKPYPFQCATKWEMYGRQWGRNSAQIFNYIKLIGILNPLYVGCTLHKFSLGSLLRSINYHVHIDTGSLLSVCGLTVRDAISALRRVVWYYTMYYGVLFMIFKNWNLMLQVLSMVLLLYV